MSKKHHKKRCFHKGRSKANSFPCLRGKKSLKRHLGLLNDKETYR